MSCPKCKRLQERKNHFAFENAEDISDTDDIQQLKLLKLYVRINAFLNTYVYFLCILNCPVYKYEHTYFHVRLPFDINRKYYSQIYLKIINVYLLIVVLNFKITNRQESLAPYYSNDEIHIFKLFEADDKNF